MATEIKELKTWGNSYGIRITKDEARRLGIVEGEPVRVDLKKVEVDTSAFPVFASGDPNVAARHDEILAGAHDQEGS